jgi:hypothetical protein
MRSSILFLLGMTACETVGPVEIFTSPRVHDAVQQATGRGIFCGWGCKTPDSDGHCHDDSSFKLTADLEATWSFDGCQTTASFNGTSLGSCATQITFHKLSDDKLEQTNVGAVSEGSGAVTYASDCEDCLAEALRSTDEGVSITQHNSAHGVGCSQEVTNIMTLHRTKGSSDPWGLCVLTVVESASPQSCLPDDWWKISQATMTRQ